VTGVGQRQPAGSPPSGGHPPEADYASALEDSAEDLYENAPCGYVSTLPDGQIVKINATLLGWLGYTRDQLVGRRHFPDLLTVGGRIYYETHLGPLLSMQGEIRSVALELQTASGARLPVLASSVLKTSAAGEPLVIRATIVDARDRRSYETELLRARREADLERERLQAAAHDRIASADEVGGDFYDLFPLSSDRWGCSWATCAARAPRPPP
jgi:sigma-B regulation protein RsbU (phosphoserine phosphatase)